MGLEVSFVESLGDIVPAVGAFLDAPPVRDIFEPETIIVPNAGVRSWLLQQIAQSVGTGPRGGDGVAANLIVKYLGHLDTLMGRGEAEEDRWAVGPLSITILSVLNRPGEPFGVHASKLGGGLKAARSLADRFDRYQARRPSMIRQWAAGNPVLEPEVGETVAAEPSSRVLDPSDMWQFELWREVHALIESPPWPVLVHDIAALIAAGSPPAGLPSRLLVAGVQSLSVRHLEVLRALSAIVDITVIMVHPSPALARTWSDRFAAVPVSHGVSPTQLGADVTGDGRSPIVASWLRGARDAQLVLASQGVTPGLPPVTPRRTDTLLGRVQATIASDDIAVATHESNDRSIEIHRAHNLSRQVEILRDALLHAFRDVPNLEPHEVVVLCADIAAAAPLLDATFAKTYASGESNIRMPLVVADRALREVDDSASLLVSVLEAARSRFSLDHVMDVATNPLVLDRFAMTGDDVGTWQRIAETSAVRWGASPEHRARVGVDVIDYDAHTWSASIERALLGAVLPDGDTVPDLGGVVPLPDVDSADVEAVTVLSRIVTVLADLSRQAASGSRSLGDWADLIEETLGQLAGDARGQLDAAFSAVETIRSYAIDAGPDAESATAVFDDVADLAIEQVSGAPGRQPLRTGAITATSLVPLRGVPFRVVCLVGFDDGTVPSGDPDGDDLVGRQSFAGDPDARLEYRRSILDAVCVASERVIVTCNGYNIRTNGTVQFITPLAELADLCLDCGARRVKDRHGDDRISIERVHPRHFTSRDNFIENGIIDGVVWSHDDAALSAFGGIAGTTTATSRRPATGTKSVKAALPDGDVLAVSPRDLHRFVDDTLHPFVRTALGINTWVDSTVAPSATVPLEVDKRGQVRLSEGLSRWDPHPDDGPTWDDVQIAIGAVPPGLYGETVLRTVRGRVASFLDYCKAWNVDPASKMSVPVEVSADGIRLKGDIKGLRDATGRLVLVDFASRSAAEVNKRAAIDLFLLRAMEVTDDLLVLCGHYDAKKPESFMARHVELSPLVTPAAALERVRMLLALYRRAASAPHPLFGKAGLSLDDPDKAKREFFNRLDSHGYLRSMECIVYGALPEFDAVYRRKKEHVEFFADLAAALPRDDDDATSGRGNSKVESPAPGHGALRAVFK